MTVEIALYSALACVPALLAIAQAIRLIRKDRMDRHRFMWRCNYGSFADPISTVWIAREIEMDKRQAVLDASSGVWTRLVGGVK